MKLEIVTPDETLYNDEVKLVQMPGIEGLFEVLENHAPLLATLKKGKIKIQDMQNQTLFFDINGGVAEVLNNKVLVLA